MMRGKISTAEFGAAGLVFHEIGSLEDPLYDSWLDLYQQSFPVDEQMLISRHNQAIRAKTGIEHIVAALDRSGVLAAIARYDLIPEAGAAALWYLAVSPEDRSKGYGSAFYGEIRRRIQAQSSAVRVVFIEVEDPKAAKPAQRSRDSERRIAFYLRNGARLIEGIKYEQSVGWQPPIPMRLMVHQFEPSATSELMRMARAVFGDSIAQGRSARPPREPDPRALPPFG